MLEPLATDLTTLVLHNSVTLATLALEGTPGHVWVEGDGVGHIQLVSVSRIDSFVQYR